MKTRVMVLDNETCNLIPSNDVQPGNNLSYDIGFRVVEPSTGAVVLDRSYIVREIFFGEMERMKSAYYANKLPQYYNDIANGKRVIKSFFEIMVEIANICKHENVIAICAHNARFDVDALNTTARYLTGLDFVRALPQSVEIWDSMKAWNACKPKAYTEFCDLNGLKTNHKPPRDKLTAEAIYKFLTNNLDFTESHTAFEDVEIETVILLACFRTHKKFAESRILYPAGA